MKNHNWFCFYTPRRGRYTWNWWHLKNIQIIVQQFQCTNDNYLKKLKQLCKLWRLFKVSLVKPGHSHFQKLRTVGQSNLILLFYQALFLLNASDGQCFDCGCVSGSVSRSNQLYDLYMNLCCEWSSAGTVMKAGESSMASKNSMSSFSSLDSPSGVRSAPSEEQHMDNLT